MAIFKEDPTELYISSLKLAGFAGAGVKIGFNLCNGISTEGPKIVIFSGSCSTFFSDPFGPGVKIKMNLGDGIFPKRTQTVHFQSQTGWFCWIWRENNL